jgi:hypothetical protein
MIIYASRSEASIIPPGPSTCGKFLFHGSISSFPHTLSDCFISIRQTFFPSRLLLLTKPELEKMQIPLASRFGFFFSSALWVAHKALPKGRQMYFRSTFPPLVAVESFLNHFYPISSAINCCFLACRSFLGFNVRVNIGIWRGKISRKLLKSSNISLS